MKDLAEFPERKRRFHIFESTINIIIKELGAAIYESSFTEEDKNRPMLFISALEMPNWNNIQ